MLSGKWRPFCLGLNVLNEFCPPGCQMQGAVFSKVCSFELNFQKCSQQFYVDFIGNKKRVTFIIKKNLCRCCSNYKTPVEHATSSHGNILLITGPLWGESTGHRFPSQRPVTQSFGISLISASTNGWANKRDTDDLRRHRAHYDTRYWQWWRSWQHINWSQHSPLKGSSFEKPLPTLRWQGSEL